MKPEKNICIYAITLVKDEEDIIEDCLCSAIKFVDKIFVYDTGSTDETWNIVKKLNLENPQIVPFKYEIVNAFSNGLRNEIFYAYRKELGPNGWWSVIDADEILIEDPKSYIKKSSFFGCDVIYANNIQYYMTYEDIEIYQKLSLLEQKEYYKKMKYYRIDGQRMALFKNHPWLKWDNTHNWPDPLWNIFYEKILRKHYKYRSPPQILKRIKVRLEAEKTRIDKDICIFWSYAHTVDDVIRKNSGGLRVDRGDGQWVYDNLMPKMKKPNFMRFLAKKVLKYLLPMIVFKAKTAINLQNATEKRF